MNKKQESKAKPIFKPWTPEEEEANRQRWREAAKRASENMKKGIHPK